ncbi:hypothetical protein [Phormidesmis sp. 146-33]
MINDYGHIIAQSARAIKSLSRQLSGWGATGLTYLPYSDRASLLVDRLLQIAESDLGDKE